MKLIDPRKFQPAQPWAALDIARINGATVRLHWTDQPYRWHINDGNEVFVVIDGEVEMHYREAGEEKVVVIKPGEIFCAGEGDEHFANPIGAARVLVIEREGSI